jgi:signal transduction histidine kinase/ActR/RegA family two-component response regulator
MCLLRTLRPGFLVGLFYILTSIGFAQEPAGSGIDQISEMQSTARKAIQSRDFEKAIIELSRANKLLSTIDNDSIKVSVQLDVAQLHYTLRNYDKAAFEAQTALQLINAGRLRNKRAAVLILYGQILTQLNRFEDAEKQLNEANSIYVRDNNEVDQASVLDALGVLRMKQGKYRDAVNYFNAAATGFGLSNDPYKIAQLNIHKAEALLKYESTGNLNAIAEAQRSLERANQIINKEGFQVLKMEYYRIASYIALRRNQYEEAERYLSIYERKNDSLDAVYLSAIYKGVEIDSNISNLRETIEEQRADIDKQQKSINLGKMTTALSIALIIILSLLTLSLYKNNNLRAKANELLQDKNNELQLAKEKAEKASLAKAQFLSTITHELRTPLYAVTGLTHLLLEEDPKPHQKEHLNSLKFSGEYLLSLINNILDLNKLEANKVELEKTTFNLKKRVNDVLIALKKSSEDRNNKLHLEFDPSIPDNLIGDPIKLSQVLINLIGNSVKFTQNGDVFVRVSKIKEEGKRVRLHFEVEDNGVGISKKKQKSIFETFSQASLQINRKFGGTGLGLSIVKNLLQLMGSKIHLESQLGKGSKFWFDLALEVAQDVQDQEGGGKLAYEVDYASLEGRRVLVVEDNKINQMITRKILEKNKLECMVADNGLDAVALVQENNFDVILMDIHMPGISGIEATEKIRTFNKDIPIIALTAVTIDENLDHFYKAGFNEIIPKPFKTEEFFEKIYRTIEGEATIKT